MDQAELFESTICAPFAVIFLDFPQHILQDRLLNRVQLSSRLGYGVIIMRKRFETFSQTTMPVVSHYKARNQVILVDASGEAAPVYQKIEVAIGNILDGMLRNTTAAMKTDTKLLE